MSSVYRPGIENRPAHLVKAPSKVSLGEDVGILISRVLVDVEPAESARVVQPVGVVFCIVHCAMAARVGLGSRSAQHRDQSKPFRREGLTLDRHRQLC